MHNLTVHIGIVFLWLFAVNLFTLDSLGWGSFYMGLRFFDWDFFFFLICLFLFCNNTLQYLEYITYSNLPVTYNTRYSTYNILLTVTYLQYTLQYLQYTSQYLQYITYSNLLTIHVTVLTIHYLQ